MDEIYRIRVKEQLHDRWSERFEDMALERLPDGTTVLTGPLADQAALHGVLARIRDLGLTLLEVDRTTEYAGRAAGAFGPDCGGKGMNGNGE